GRGSVDDDFLNLRQLGDDFRRRLHPVHHERPGDHDFRGCSLEDQVWIEGGGVLCGIEAEYLGAGVSGDDEGVAIDAFRPAVDNVPAAGSTLRGGPMDDVVSGATIDDIVASAAVDRIVSGLPVDGIV